MTATLILRIFLSSPGDVAEERQLARDAIAELQREPQFESVRLDAVSWDDPQGRTPLVAQLDPQAAVARGLPSPSQCDVVIGIFWAHMGSPLPADKYRKPDGSPYLSGTEYELADAFATPDPDVLLYRRGEQPHWHARDPEWHEKHEQLARLDAYLASLKTVPRYIDVYATPPALKEPLKRDLRKVLAGRLQVGPLLDAYQQARATAVSERLLNQADARLVTMPLDVVPAPAALPPGSHMPLARNALFVGREADLKALAGALKAGGTAAVGQAATVTGLGGIGKTQLASEFVHRYGQYFVGGVFWLSFAEPAAVPAEMATCGGSGGLKLRDDFGNLPLEEQVRLVAAEWQGPLPRLLVFDNCEDEALLDRWRPRAGGSRVLVTSRRESWSPELGVLSVPLGVLGRSESVALLGKHREDLDQTDPLLNDIAQELGDLPLALHLAGSFLGRYRHAALGQLAHYVEQLSRPDLLEHRSLTVGGRSPTGHEEHVARTFALSHDRLDDGSAVNALARTMLACAACFAPGEPIPRNLLRLCTGVETDSYGELRFEDGLQRLRDLGLIAEQKEGALVLHRLLAAFAQGQSCDPVSVRTQVEGKVAEEANRLNEAGYPAPLLPWQPQLRFLAERATDGSQHAAGLLGNLAYHLRLAGDIQGAKVAYERLVASERARLGPDHPDLMPGLNNLGSVLNALGDRAAARSAYEEALAIGEGTLSPDDPRIATCVNNFGMLLKEQGDLAAAQAAFERALAIDEASFGTDHPSVAKDVNNLGGVLYDQRDLAGAKAALERALATFERALGPLHPYVAATVNNLGSVLREQGDLAGARAAFERALGIDETNFGPDHPDVAVRVNNLAGVLQKQGDLAGASAALERALSILERVLGPDHPQVATAVNNLGTVLQDLGNAASARAAFERALGISEASFGSDHTSVATALNNLGDLLRNQNDVAGARAAYQRALAIFEGVFGPDHPSTRKVRGSLERLGGG
jgi:tetratricopeptide (TPR) repeat protein